jgi:23S rRNA pseudouridine1911/1915/1917 synthase
MQDWRVAPEDAGVRLDQWLARRVEGGSRRRAAEWLTRGKVFLDGQPVELAAAGLHLSAGQRVGLWMDRPGSSRPAERQLVDRRHLLSLVHVDESLVVVDKLPGLLVEPLPGRSGEEVTVLDLLEDRFRHEPRSRFHVVHRIDRDTSGLVLLARTASCRDQLKVQFEAHTPERVYLAVVQGVPQPDRGVWRDRLAWDSASLRQRRAHGKDARGKDACARYRIAETFAGAALLEVSLLTGKRNQIRVQAALRGHPLLGERQYRFDAPDAPSELPAPKRQALHAWRLGFTHPVSGQDMTFEAPTPSDLTGLLAALQRAVPTPASPTSPQDGASSGSRPGPGRARRPSSSRA